MSTNSPNPARSAPLSVALATPAEASSRQQPQASKAVYLQLALVVLFWASNWLIMKSTLAHISPMDFNVLRFWGAAVVMGILAFPMRAPLVPVAGERLGLAVIGMLQIAGLLVLSTIGLQYVGPGRATVLVYTMQLWALPIGWLIAGDRIKPRALLGGTIGFLGVVMFVNPMLVNWHDRRALLGNGLMLVGSINWALGSCLYRRRRWQTPFWTQSFWQTLWSAPATTVVAFAFPDHRPFVWTTELTAVFLYNWLCATGLAYLLWGKVLTTMPVSRAGQIVCLVPIIAVIMSAFIFGERITPLLVVSMLVIGAGMFLTLRSR